MGKNGQMNKLTIATYCHHPDKILYRRIVESCNYFGYNLFIYYGDGSHWSGNRVWIINSFLDQLRLVKTEYVYLTDAFDVWMLRDEKSILEAFKSYDCNILLPSCRRNEPIDKLGNKFPVSPTSYRYVNGGQTMARTRDLIDLYELLLKKYSIEKTTNQQGDLSYAVVNKDADIKIDYYCKVFQTMIDVDLDELKIVDGIIINKETGSNPCSIHFTGPKEEGGFNIKRMISFYDKWNLLKK